MSAADDRSPEATVTDAAGRIATASSLGVLGTLRAGVLVSPELLTGLGLTLVLAVLAAGGRVVVPIAVQQSIDTGLLAAGGVDAGRVGVLVAVAALVIVLAGTCSALVNVRLVSRTEAGLKTLRVKAFRHVHDLSVLSQDSERRGALVSRVTSDVDTISMFVQWGGIMLLVASLQLTVATALMAVYSWQLTLLVWACFIPLALVLPRLQRGVNRAFSEVRAAMGGVLGSVSEAVLGAETIRAHAAQARTRRRVDDSVVAHRDSQVRAQVRVAAVFSGGMLVSNLVLVAVVVAGTFLGMAGDISLGRLLAFLFLVQLFTGPVQLATEILNELQNAVAGWRRVLAVLETPVTVADPADGVVSPRGAATVELRGVSYAYPDGPTVLDDVDLVLPPRTRVAVVGRTGSGKTTLAKLVARLMYPSAGEILLDGTDLRRLRAASLRARIVLVPQEGFLFDGTLADNIAYGARDLAPGENARPLVEEAVTALGLGDWLADRPGGLDAPVGQRGEALSAGERQLVALARAYLARADLLVLDEATSAVDPATEVRVARAFEQLAAGRSTMTIAHRLSTAESADLVVVVDAGRVVEVGPHRELVGAGGVYARMHEAWIAQTR
ncbi:ABC transporter ATP-binding protein [Sanguibacter sp. HDW7]|uniref:ABC transporter ATP-binding protein n=1 Tax=Sanguibacter sp. HDW7 TaxID=2714931 RepID=UPI0014092CE1|nr:ABC transporter ATP-binding protein [Sanguibacter sp. HDW7]QIK83437.1 ABC transporter ATP-binding protein [Sanguibacter sp. HDW7]